MLQSSIFLECKFSYMALLLFILMVEYSHFGLNGIHQHHVALTYLVDVLLIIWKCSASIRSSVMLIFKLLLSGEIIQLF